MTPHYNSHEVIVRHYYDETLPKSMELTLNIPKIKNLMM